MDSLKPLFDVFLDPDLRLAPIYLVAFVALAALIWALRDRREGKGFLRWLFPREIYLHPSHLVDIQLFLLNRALTLFGAFNAVAINTAAIILVIAGLSAATGSELTSGPWSWSQMLLVTVVLVVVGDFCTYWVHRVSHETPVLWPFHALHHSAEVMTPVTAYRKHPVYDYLNSVARAALVGVATGFVLFFITSDINLVTIGGANIIYAVFNVLGSNFRHTHIWISYGPVLERILISPAQHQIHHSLEVEHHNKNYGEVFAIWDWMFGTLYVPQGRTELRFGLADRRGNLLAQPHPTLKDALVGPFRDSAKAFSRRFGGKRGGKPVTPR